MRYKLYFWLISKLTDRGDPQKIVESIGASVPLDYLAAGLTSKVTIFIQSQIPRVGRVVNVIYMNLVSLASS